MNTEKNTMMRDEMSSIMDLEFFSKRFNIRQELMSWGLQKITTEERISYIPVVIIKDGQVFIDIRKDSFSSRNSAYGQIAELLPAVMTESEDAYTFTADKDIQYVFKKKDLEDIYGRKMMLPKKTVGSH